MTTTTRVLDANVNGTVYTANVNSALEALDTCHSGPTPPTDEVANGKFWLDTTTTPSILKMYDNATWNVVPTSDSPTFAALSDGTDTVETGYVINGSAKAWVNFNGTGTVAIRDSLNVSSLTDNGVGDYTVNFSNSLVVGYYADFSASVPNLSFPRSTGTTSQSDMLGASVRFTHGYTNPLGTGVPEDPNFAGTSAFGDLA